MTRNNKQENASLSSSVSRRSISSRNDFIMTPANTTSSACRSPLLYGAFTIKMPQRTVLSRYNKIGLLMFYDLRAGKYLESNIHSSKTVTLKASKGYVIAATEQKTVVEEAQRNRAKNVAVWVPRFFHQEPAVSLPEGITDQGWKYNHANKSPWNADEIVEYEEDFVVQSLRGLPVGGVRAASEPRLRESIRRASDSDTHDELAPRAKVSTRTLKQTLISIDSSLREQTLAIERLNKQMEMLSESQRAPHRPHNMGRVPATAHSWDLFGGFILAIVLQALLKWLFYHKD